MYIYNNIGANSISFEIVFVGPNEPDYTLPSNFKYIKSNVKPAQCTEIASRYASGELLLNMFDDVDFRTPSPLDKLYGEYMSYGDEKLMLSCRYMMEGVDVSNECHRFYVQDPTSPIMPVAGLVSAKMYRSLGGVDRNFICAYLDLDIAMRLYAIGGRVLLSNIYLSEVTAMSLGLSRVVSAYGAHDRGLLDNLWVVEGKLQFTRTKPFEPFSDERILEESQGPRGEWD
jgi:hypothetical protein